MRSQGILHFFMSPIHWAHRAVIFATARLSCFLKLSILKTKQNIQFVILQCHCCKYVDKKYYYSGVTCDTVLSTAKASVNSNNPLDMPKTQS